MINSNNRESDNSDTITMLEEYHRRGLKSKVKTNIPKVSSPKIALPVKPLRKWRDAYVEMMLTFAGNATRLNNGN